MDFISIILISIGLSFDSFAVSVSSGLSMCRKSRKIGDVLLIAGSLAFFQASMPVIGWFLGATVKDVIQLWDHWIAFVLLGFLGGRMIIEGTKPHGRIKNPTHWKVLIGMSIATSIDAFAVGISFSFLSINIWVPVLVIGVVTFIVSYIGLMMGRMTGKRMAGKAEILGGVILILMGIKILIEHLFFQ